MLGLDDLRDVQPCRMVDVPTGDGSHAKGFQILSGPLKIYLNSETKAVVDKCFGYLTTKPEYLDESRSIIPRRVALLDFEIIENESDLNLYGLPVHSFPVYHGGDYISLGFAIGKEGEFVYISDVKIVPSGTLVYLKGIAPRIKVLVLDALDRDRGVWSHMGMEEALKFAREINPEVIYFVGTLLHKVFQSLLFSFIILFWWI